MLRSLRQYQESEIAQERKKMMEFYEKYGEKATQEAYGADRKLISRWRQRLKERGLMGLKPLSTRPRRVRRSEIPQEIVAYIRTLREKHPRLGKEKIKVLLDEHCQEQRIKTISVATIGNVIKRHKMFYQKTGRIYHNPSSKWAQNPSRKKRLRVRYSPKPQEAGYILSDTVERVTDGIKDYFFNAIDGKMKFALSLNYKRLNSRNMKDFYQRFKKIYPCQIQTWQSDNGSENLGEFDQALDQDRIPHRFIYPRCPKINSYIERYNRTFQEEFLDNHLDIIHDKPLFNRALADWLIFYNAKRPHHSLGLKNPLQYLLQTKAMSHMSLTYTSP